MDDQRLLRDALATRRKVLEYLRVAQAEFEKAERQRDAG